ncbi:MAG: glutathione peroxidase [Planctomycetaceae bacterium]|nr:MAG: glutathione peroxidase [Planctomycetaceae bacterium]
MRTLMVWGCLGVMIVGVLSAAEVPEVLSFKMKSLRGEEVDLSRYRGKVLLIVNVASRCGATPQYKQLQSLYDTYSDRGLVVLGFPCNQFGGQEPGSAEEIAAFCRDNYAVTFDMFDKIDVNGEQAAPLYKYLTTHAPTKGPIKWNFEKFIISRDGKIVARFGTGVKPDAPEVIRVLEAELAKPAP